MTRSDDGREATPCGSIEVIEKTLYEKAILLALPLIKRWEGFREKAYRDPVGIPTVGYGFTRLNGRKVTMNDRITEPEAEQVLRRLVEGFMAEVDTMVQRPITANQLAALTSFAFNLGTWATKKSSLVRRLNSGDIKGAAAVFDWYVYAGKRRLKGLIRRRAEERQLFEKA